MRPYLALACSLFALAGWGGVTLVDSSGGTGGAISTGGSGTGGGADGGTCAQSPGGHTISIAGRSTACAPDSDCALVYTGNLCVGCTCPSVVISASDLASYQAEETAMAAGCCPVLTATARR
jgi:hypothetical protein